MSTETVAFVALAAAAALGASQYLVQIKDGHCQQTKVGGMVVGERCGVVDFIEEQKRRAEAE